MKPNVQTGGTEKTAQEGVPVLKIMRTVAAIQMEPVFAEKDTKEITARRYERFIL